MPQRPECTSTLHAAKRWTRTQACWAEAGHSHEARPQRARGRMRLGRRREPALRPRAGASEGSHPSATRSRGAPPPVLAENR